MPMMVHIIVNLYLMMERYATAASTRTRSYYNTNVAQKEGNTEPDVYYGKLLSPIVALYAKADSMTNPRLTATCAVHTNKAGAWPTTRLLTTT